MPSKTARPKLSRGVLDMKFMQRTKVKVAKEADDEQSRLLYSNEINEKMMNCNSNFIIEPSFSICEGLIDGRLSFRGMNPELERLMELEKTEKESKVKHEQPKEVTDADMAAAYYANKAPGITKSMQRKFSTKNENNKRNHVGPVEQQFPSNNKRPKQQKFKKPRSDDEDTET